MQKCLSFVVAAGLLGTVFPAAAGELAKASVLVEARACDYPESPVSATVPLSVPAVSASLRFRGSDAPPAPCQLEKTGGNVRVTWIMPPLKKGESRVGEISLSDTPPGVPSLAVRESEQVKGGLDVLVDGALFTTYHTQDVPRPFFHPVVGPGGAPVTRAFPMQKVPGETADHPHHRSFWFTFDPVNNVNFWADSPKSGKIVHRSFDTKAGGPVFALIRSTNDWIGPDGKKVCEDTRALRVYRLSEGRLLDFEVTLRAVEGPIAFGDSKEGMFAFRVADSMRLKGGGGHIENSRGLKDKDAWGKPAEWCDYYGPVEGQTVGIAVFDHPANHAHPTHWHARDYGLFAANPFGLRAFTGDKTKDGGHTVPAGGSITFRYRVLLHKGSTAEAGVSEFWSAYATPLDCVVR